jgi:hypothetical protein
MHRAVRQTPVRLPRGRAELRKQHMVERHLFGIFCRIPSRGTEPQVIAGLEFVAGGPQHL